MMELKHVLEAEPIWFLKSGEELAGYVVIDDPNLAHTIINFLGVCLNVRDVEGEMSFTVLNYGTDGKGYQVNYVGNVYAQVNKGEGIDIYDLVEDFDTVYSLVDEGYKLYIREADGV